VIAQEASFLASICPKIVCDWNCHVYTYKGLALNTVSSPLLFDGLAYRRNSARPPKDAIDWV
jgi:hypothetical protein